MRRTGKCVWRVGLSTGVGHKRRAFSLRDAKDVCQARRQLFGGAQFVSFEFAEGSDGTPRLYRQLGLRQVVGFAVAPQPLSEGQLRVHHTLLPAARVRLGLCVWYSTFCRAFCCAHYSATRTPWMRCLWCTSSTTSTARSWQYQTARQAALRRRQ